MSSGSYTRRVCPACGTKGRLTSVSIVFGMGSIEPPPITGSRCGKCGCESVGGRVVKRARPGPPGSEEIVARIAVIEAEIIRIEASIESKQADVGDLKAVHDALQEKLL